MSTLRRSDIVLVPGRARRFSFAKDVGTAVGGAGSAQQAPRAGRADRAIRRMLALVLVTPPVMIAVRASSDPNWRESLENLVFGKPEAKPEAVDRDEPAMRPAAPPRSSDDGSRASDDSATSSAGSSKPPPTKEELIEDLGKELEMLRKGVAELEAQKAQVKENMRELKAAK